MANQIRIIADHGDKRIDISKEITQTTTVGHPSTSEMLDALQRLVLDTIVAMGWEEQFNKENECS